MIYNGNPSHWQQTNLRHLIEYKKGFAFKSQDYQDAGYPVIRVSDFTDRSINLSSCNYLSVSKAKDYEFYKLHYKDVIIATVGSWPSNPASIVGKAVRVPREADGALLNQNAVLLRGKSDINQDFLFYRLKNLDFMYYIVAGAQGSANQASITLEAIFKFPFLLPPLSEQQAIAHILGSLDDKIELNRQMNETFEGIARALFKSWFVDFDPVRAKMDGRMPYGMDAETAALFPDGFEDSALGEIPKGWKAVSLPEIIEVNPPRSLHHGMVSPYLEMSNVSNTSARVLAWENRAFSSGAKFISGDTLVARITPCLENGKTAFVDFLAENEVGWGSTEYIVMRSRPPFPIEYSYFLARSDNFRTYAIRNMTGTSGRQRVPTVCFNSYFIVEPSPECAKIFGEFAQPMMQAIKQNDEESQTLATIRDTLLPKLLSGEIRVRDAEKEVGVVL